MLTDKPSIVHATAPKYSRRRKPAESASNGPAIVTPQEVIRLPSETTSASAMPRIVQARKPGSKPYLSPNVSNAAPDPDADRKVKAFLKKMMPNHPMVQDDD